jgi:hypothetical protein
MKTHIKIFHYFICVYGIVEILKGKNKTIINNFHVKLSNVERYLGCDQLPACRCGGPVSIPGQNVW